MSPLLNIIFLFNIVSLFSVLSSFRSKRPRVSLTFVAELISIFTRAFSPPARPILSLAELSEQIFLTLASSGDEREVLEDVDDRRRDAHDCDWAALDLKET